MTLSHSPESHDELPIGSLEEFKGNPEAPFPVVEKGQEAPIYNYNFAKNVRSKWSDICDLMEWNKEGGEPIDYKTFRVAVDPTSVVSSIQRKLIAEGGHLSRHGVDGLFGSETKSALRDVLHPRPEPLISPEDAEEIDTILDDSETAEGEAKQLSFRETVNEMNRVRGKVTHRLESAFGPLNKIDLANASLDELKAYQKKAAGLRASLSSESPEIEKFNSLTTGMMDVAKGHLQSLDLITVRNMGDLMHHLTSVDDVYKMEFELLLSEFDVEASEVEEFMDPFGPKRLDMELLLTYSVAFILEAAFLTLEGCYDQKDDFQRVSDFYFSPLFNHFTFRVDEGLEEPEPELFEGWDDLADQGPMVRGSMDLKNEDRTLTINADDLTFSLGDHVGHLVLPDGAKLNSFTVQKNGRLQISARMKYGNVKRTLTKEQLLDLMDDMEESKPGDELEIATGIYLRV